MGAHLLMDINQFVYYNTTSKRGLIKLITIIKFHGCQVGLKTLFPNCLNIQKTKSKSS